MRIADGVVVMAMDIFMDQLIEIVHWSGCGHFLSIDVWKCIFHRWFWDELSIFSIHGSRLSRVTLLSQEELNG